MLGPTPSGGQPHPHRGRLSRSSECAAEINPVSVANRPRGYVETVQRCTGGHSNTVGAICAARAQLPVNGNSGAATEDESILQGHQVDLAVVWIFAEVMFGGLAVGTLLILIRPRDDEARALYRREPRRAWVWLQDRLVVFRIPSKPDLGSRQ